VVRKLLQIVSNQVQCLQIAGILRVCLALDILLNSLLRLENDLSEKPEAFLRAFDALKASDSLELQRASLHAAVLAP
jgi:hypothetical protein